MMLTFGLLDGDLLGFVVTLAAFKVFPVGDCVSFFNGSVGATDGLVDGNCVGSIVGTAVGATDGLVDGNRVGSIVGSVVGADVEADGDSVGLNVATVGAVDGSIVATVGFNVGSLVGDAEGSDDGFMVGL